MTREELYRLVTWRDANEVDFECFLPAFAKTVKAEIFTSTPQEISDRSIQIVNDFIGLTHEHLALIKNLLWEDCQSCCEDMSWGVDVVEGKTETEANHEYLGVFNEEDAYQKSSLSLNIYEDDQEEYESNYGYLCFDNSWNSHLTTVVMKNGNIVGYGDSGLYVGEFEN